MPTPSTVTAEHDASSLTREEATQAFGVTYLHGGRPNDPVEEVLGRHVLDPDPARGRKAFATEAAAVDHARASFRERATLASDRMAAADGGRGARVRLWLARNWLFWRRREVGLLASDGIAHAHRRMGEDAASFRPRLARLPERLRMPVALDLDTPVWVVDVSSFPDVRMEVRADSVDGREVVGTPGHPAFDFVLRYRLAGTEGLFSYDTTDPATKRLGGMSEDVRPFLDEASARRETERLAGNLREAMGVVAEPAPVVALPAPGPQPLLAAPERLPAPLDWSPCDHVGAFLDGDFRVVRPGGLADGESLSAALVAWAGTRPPLGD